jgi:hypothetical protein
VAVLAVALLVATELLALASLSDGGGPGGGPGGCEPSRLLTVLVVLLELAVEPPRAAVRSLKKASRVLLSLTLLLVELLELEEAASALG